MTNHDNELLSRAVALGPLEWIEIDKLAKQAESEEARKKLNKMAAYGYHYEEGRAGNI